MRGSVVAVLLVVSFLIGALVGYYLGYYMNYHINNFSVQSSGLHQYTETLVNYTSISQPAGQYTEYTFTLNYPGYIKVIVYSSTTTKTYIQITGYSIQGISYTSGQVDVGDSGNLSYPVLPGSVKVDIGNYNLINGATEQIEIIYVYYASS
ncbi:hypothetical protein EWF20_06160 [Sulfolobus sp. S-194]|uniref:hypothetical protein n=1 Tax=Sulfolobus sp. S-194 TaxID=2512240 RepID=UPI0014372851|nr:hypothetical protein [Sulfolobus sp. S-194]QIW23780.1 hypothetical protein EWF20_06160 [Sulfolobus sp. S-194]